MKILPVEAELFRADRRTDLTKLTIAFDKFANASKNRERLEISHMMRNVYLTAVYKTNPLYFPLFVVLYAF
jgi:hypothetical protein